MSSRRGQYEILVASMHESSTTGFPVLPLMPMRPRSRARQIWLSAMFPSSGRASQTSRSPHPEDVLWPRATFHGKPSACVRSKTSCGSVIRWSASNIKRLLSCSMPSNLRRRKYTGCPFASSTWLPSLSTFCTAAKLRTAKIKHGSEDFSDVTHYVSCCWSVSVPNVLSVVFLRQKLLKSSVCANTSNDAPWAMARSTAWRVLIFHATFASSTHWLNTSAVQGTHSPKN